MSYLDLISRVIGLIGGIAGAISAVYVAYERMKRPKVHVLSFGDSQTESTVRFRIVNVTAKLVSVKRICLFGYEKRTNSWREVCSPPSTVGPRHEIGGERGGPVEYPLLINENREVDLAFGPDFHLYLIHMATHFFIDVEVEAGHSLQTDVVRVSDRKVVSFRKPPRRLLRQLPCIGR